MRRIAAIVTSVLTGFVLVGCGGGSGDDDPIVVGSGGPPSVAEASPSVTIPGSAGVADDPPGTATCAQLADAVTAGSLMTVGVVDGIVAASRTADAPLADAAARLGAAYRAAVAAAGKGDEPDKVAAVAAAASDMSGVCAESGLRTVG
jgi:hypothetical protein